MLLFDPAPPRWTGTWVARPVNIETARKWIGQWHYLEKTNTSSTSWGVFAPDLIAVIQVGMTANEHGLGTRYGLNKWKGNAEITRVVVHPEAPKNTASRAMATICQRIYEQERREWLFSYADTGVGHHGGIYQALNAIYLGVTSDRNGWLLDGEPTHPRVIVHKFGTQARDRAPEVAKARGHELVYAPNILKPKHTYVLTIGRPAIRRAIRKHLEQLGVVLPYPKRGDEELRQSVKVFAGVAELVDASDSKSDEPQAREGSIPSLGTSASAAVSSAAVAHTVDGDLAESPLTVADAVPLVALDGDGQPDGGVPSSSTPSSDKHEPRNGGWDEGAGPLDTGASPCTSATVVGEADNNSHAVEVSSGDTSGVHSEGAGSIPADRSEILNAGEDMYLLLKYIRPRTDDDTGMMVDAALVGWENATT
jgi:hypothetical protein